MGMRQSTSEEWTDRVSAIRAHGVGGPDTGKLVHVAVSTGEVVSRVEYPAAGAIAYFIDEVAIERAAIAQQGRVA